MYWPYWRISINSTCSKSGRKYREKSGFLFWIWKTQVLPFGLFSMVNAQAKCNETKFKMQWDKVHALCESEHKIHPIGKMQPHTAHEGGEFIFFPLTIISSSFNYLCWYAELIELSKFLFKNQSCPCLILCDIYAILHAKPTANLMALVSFKSHHISDFSRPNSSYQPHCLLVLKSV